MMKPTLTALFLVSLTSFAAGCVGNPPAQVVEDAPIQTVAAEPQAAPVACSDVLDALVGDSGNPVTDVGPSAYSTYDATSSDSVVVADTSGGLLMVKLPTPVPGLTVSIMDSGHANDHGSSLQVIPNKDEAILGGGWIEIQKPCEHATLTYVAGTGWTGATDGVVEP